ncbi:MAG: hypothetical protein IKN57_03170 [Parasporobacterium sp.]|nr:hypothetical protein [Parasporobacterium sp.]
MEDLKIKKEECDVEDMVHVSGGTEEGGDGAAENGKKEKNKEIQFPMAP